MKLVLVYLFAFWATLLGGWNTNFEAAQKEAQENNKLILLNFSGSDWCAPCIKLKKEVLTTASFESYADKKLVLVRADFPRLKKNQLETSQKAANEALAAKYNPKGKFPLTVLLNAKGEVLKTWEGYTKENSEAALTASIDKYLVK
jgi:thioredoxin-related protein